MTAAPDFTAFFEGAYQRALDTVQVPGEPDASWDRKSAYLLWLATDRGARTLDTSIELQIIRSAGSIFA